MSDMCSSVNLLTFMNIDLNLLSSKFTLCYAE